MRSLLLQCADGADYREMLRITHKRHDGYTKYFGFDYWWLQGRRSRFHSWDKLALIYDALRAGYEFVVYMDADAVIIDLTHDLRGALAIPGVGMIWSQVPGGEPLHFQTGVIYVRNGQGVPELFKELLRRQPLEYSPAPLWWQDPQNEQTIINAIAQEAPWSELFHKIEYRWNVIAGYERETTPVVLHLAGMPTLMRRIMFLQHVCLQGGG